LKKRRNIAILGSTGSIGRNALEVISNFPDEFQVTYLAAHRNVDLLKEQIRRFKPAGVAMLSRTCAELLKGSINGSCEVLVGDDGLMELAGRPDVDIVLNALVGFAGLRPTLCAIEAGKDIALANKETLVVAGELIMSRVREKGVRLLPIDSEHSAILQCLRGESIDEVARLILTASGGPLLNTDKAEFETISVAQALNHPTWKMGNKITIDSATLMNKGLEVIEAHWLFGLPLEKIEVVIHPQSIIHSMVEFADGSVKAQMGMPDMKLPIQYALMYPRRPASICHRMDFERIHQMTFLKPDPDKFRCLALAREALQTGGTAPAVLNAANEVAVQLFLEERLPFASIPALIEESLSWHTPVHNITLDDVVRADNETRAHVMHHSAIAP
jgi:1-deoxy-D-xylulose-5-phosphate reductoisomerase